MLHYIRVVCVSGFRFSLLDQSAGCLMAKVIDIVGRIEDESEAKPRRGRPRKQPTDASPAATAALEASDGVETKPEVEAASPPPPAVAEAIPLPPVILPEPPPAPAPELAKVVDSDDESSPKRSSKSKKEQESESPVENVGWAFLRRHG